MKVIFLDFDGVINNWDTFDGVDENNVMRLLKIVSATNAKIVATTSNKYSFQVYGIDYEKSRYFEYVRILNKYGIEIFDVTPCVKQNREEEIGKYLNEHSEIDNFLILDDDYVSSNFREHQVFLDLYNGIMDEHIVPAIRILNGELGFYPPNFDFDETCEERNIRINEYHSLEKKNGLKK